MSNDGKQPFNYTYSAEQKKEIERIRSKYTESEVSALDVLKALDKGVTKRGLAVSLTVGILGTLIMGFGMCVAMLWSIPTDALFFVGIGVGLVGIALISVAYPLYSRITERERKRIAPQIMKMSEELLKQ